MKEFRSCTAALIRTAKSVRWKLLASYAIGALRVALSLSFVWISKRVVDIATGAVAGELDRSVIAMAAIMLLQVATLVAARYWEGYIIIRTTNTNREAYFRKAFCSSWDGRNRFHSADTVSRLEEDIRIVTEFLCINLPNCFVTLTQLIAASIFLFTLAPALAWLLIFIMPVAVIGSRLFFKRMRRLTGEIRKNESEIQSHMQENLQQRLTVRTLGGSTRVLDRMRTLQSELQGKTVRRLNYEAFSRTFMQLGFAAGYATAFFWGVYGLRSGAVTYGLMVAFLQLSGQVQRPVAELTHHIPAFIKALSSQERLMEIDELESESEGPALIVPGVPGVRVEGLSYSYPGREEKVLESLDFDFKPGTLTVIAGPTGAGKSTLARVILALLKPESGRVVLYSPEVETCTETRGNFMYVPQGNTLMSGTIRQNLLLAKQDATEEELNDALTTAVADFVFELPEGLDTPCSEIGQGLSEGQAQRVAIARALLRPGGVLILDEATSALDAETEVELLERLNRRYRGIKTVICITHRPAAGAYADAVLKLG